jgi:holliday junction DNA helicase RuvA
MIGKLTGLIDSVAEDHVLIDVNGVGYVVFCPSSTLARLKGGEHTSLVTEMRVSEDAVRLYGFLSGQERDWFRLLQTVQGVGAKVALAILTVLSPRDLSRVLALGDKAMIGRAQGVGPKLALRIVTELKDKAPKMMAGGGQCPAAGPIPAVASAGAQADASAALVKLGYSDSTAAEAVARAVQGLGETAPLDAVIRAALKGM